MANDQRSPVARLTRRYSFSASHRMHSRKLSEEDNRRIYGKCNNPYGHGHNYELEVSVAGPIDPLTGMVVNLVDLDRIISEEVLERFDHTNLNKDLENFRDVVPTSENLGLEIRRLLLQRWEREPALGGARLAGVRLQETGANSFEFLGA